VLCFGSHGLRSRFSPIGVLTDLKLPLDSENKGKGRVGLTLSSQTGQKLVDTIDFPNFLDTMLHIILHICETQAPHSENAQIVDYAMQMMVNLIISKPALIKNFYECKPAKQSSPEKQASQAPAQGIIITLSDLSATRNETMTPIEDFILNVTLAHSEQKVRKAASSNFNRLCSQ